MSDHIKVNYGKINMTVPKNTSMEAIMSAFSDIFPELRGVMPTLKVGESGTIVEYRKKNIDDIVSWIGYIVLGQKVHYIKDISKLEVVQQVASLQRGDMLNIKGLGTLHIVNVFNNVERDGNLVYEEIGLYCERVTHYEI